MSRGPGKVQRHILEQLESRGHAYLVDLLPVDATKATYNAYSRAALKLADAGVIECKLFQWGGVGNGSDMPRTLFALHGRMPDGRPRPDRDSKLSAGTAENLPPIQHLDNDDQDAPRVLEGQ